MNTNTASLFHLRSLFLVALLSIMCAMSAMAQATRTWVSGVGDDANPCSRTAPCKTFAGAISKTAAGGEISVLDPGGFGVVTITKAITINGDATLGGILSSGTNGIIVNAGANDVVILRNLSINGAGSGINGIRFLAGKQLISENMTISGVTGHGLDVALSAAGKVTLRNVTISNCGGAGINIAAGGTPITVAEKVQISDCGIGVAAANGTTSIIQSVITQNTNQALLASANGAVINAEACALTSNATGVDVTVAGAIIRLSNCAITANTTGISSSAGTVVSFGNNKNTGNTTNGAPTTLLAQQ